jgi:hypothetical protein
MERMSRFRLEESSSAYTDFDGALEVGQNPRENASLECITVKEDVVSGL